MTRAAGSSKRVRKEKRRTADRLQMIFRFPSVFGRGCRSPGWALAVWARTVKFRSRSLGSAHASLIECESPHRPWQA